MQIIRSIFTISLTIISLPFLSQITNAATTVELSPAQIYLDMPEEEADQFVDWSVDVPVSELGSKADQAMERFIVTADRWINPQFMDIRNFLRGAPNGSSTPEPTSERRRVCSNFAALSAAAKCKSTEAAPPGNILELNINYSEYTTWLLWQDTLLNFARSIFDNQLPVNPNPYRAPLNIASEAFREAVGKCNTESRCIRQVYQFFGAAVTSLPDLPYIGNINDLVNGYLGAIGLPPSLGNSPAGTILQRYGNNTFCQIIKDDANSRGCKI